MQAPDHKLQNEVTQPSKTVNFASNPGLSVLHRSNDPRKPKFARLKPGHSPIDWARLKDSGKNLKGVERIGRYTLEQVAMHNKRNDCWVVIKGKIYNVTAYLPFHPGGKGELMRGAGKDATDLFIEYHSWVNPELMLDSCLVGFLV